MPTPRKGEKVKDYVPRCISMRQSEHPDEDVNQSVAICYSMYDETKDTHHSKGSDKFDLNSGEREVMVQRKTRACFEPGACMVQEK